VTQRTLQIENIYELYDDETTIVTVDLLPPSEFDSQAAYDEYLYDTIHPLTGVGHEDGNSAYFVKSIDDLQPAIDEEYGL
jgi:hypothetical protein